MRRVAPRPPALKPTLQRCAGAPAAAVYVSRSKDIGQVLTVLRNDTEEQVTAVQIKLGNKELEVAQVGSSRPWLRATT